MCRTPNPDQQLLHAFANGAPPCAIDSNPLAKLLGTTLIELNRDARTVRLGFAPTSGLLQGAGVVQGGLVCAMLDFAMAFATLACLEEGDAAATANLNVSYLRAVRDENLLATSSIDHLGKKLAFARAELLAANGTLLATANSTLAIFR
jgi:uncharacterized protein (TIGR00369 family)